jgi:hypothetical protein
VPLRFRVFLAMPQDYPKAATAIGRYDDDKTGAGSSRPRGRAGPASGSRPGHFRLSSKAGVVPGSPGSALLHANASVDLGEEDRDAPGGEVTDVIDGRLARLGAEHRLQRVHVLERELGNALIGIPSGVATPRAASNRCRPGIAFASPVWVSA